MQSASDVFFRLVFRQPLGSPILFPNQQWAIDYKNRCAERQSKLDGTFWKQGRPSSLHPRRRRPQLTRPHAVPSLSPVGTCALRQHCRDFSLKSVYVLQHLLLIMRTLAKRRSCGGPTASSSLYSLSTLVLLFWSSAPLISPPRLQRSQVPTGICLSGVCHSLY